MDWWVIEIMGCVISGINKLLVVMYGMMGIRKYVEMEYEVVDIGLFKWFILRKFEIVVC